MKILSFIGSALYAVIASYLIWLLFNWVTPWVMSFGWIGVIGSVLCGSLFIGLFLSVCTLLLSPLLALINNGISKIIPLAAFLFNGFSSAMLPWRLEVVFSLPKIILGLTLTCVVLVVFITALQAIWVGKKDAL